MRADIVPGGIFPDYELTDHTKARRRLSELQGIDPMILVLSRGGFCPKDHQQHLELAAHYPKIRVAYTQIVTISTDNILKTNEFRDSVGAQWTFLSDACRHIQKDLDIQEYTDSYYDPMIPHTLVLKPGLVIYSVYNATGTGAGPRSRTCAAIFARLPARSARTGTRPHPAFAGLGRRRPLDAPPVPAVRPYADRNIRSARKPEILFHRTDGGATLASTRRRAVEYLLTSPRPEGRGFSALAGQGSCFTDGRLPALRAGWSYTISAGLNRQPGGT